MDYSFSFNRWNKEATFLAGRNEDFKERGRMKEKR